MPSPHGKSLRLIMGSEITFGKEEIFVIAYIVGSQELHPRSAKVAGGKSKVAEVPQTPVSPERSGLDSQPARRPAKAGRPAISLGDAATPRAGLPASAGHLRYLERMLQMRRFRARSCRAQEYHEGRHRFEHWYRDNSVYFITARCRERYPAFQSEVAKTVFWDRFDHYTQHYGFVPWVTTLLDNHYHTLGYLKVGEQLGPMMQRIHGSVAKLVNDVLPGRHPPFGAKADGATILTGAFATKSSVVGPIDIHYNRAFGPACIGTGATIVALIAQSTSS